MSRLTIGRRRMLAALGLGAAAAAPVFRRGIRRAAAQSTPPPQRFVGIYHPAGWRVWPRTFSAYERRRAEYDAMCFPGGRREGDVLLSDVVDAWPEETAPLRRVQDELVFIDGLHNWANRGGNNHMAGIHTFLTGADPVQQFQNVGGESLDYFLAREAPTQFAGIHLCLQQRACAMSASGVAQPNFALTDPAAAYRRYFVSLAEGDSADERREQLERTRALRRSVLDHLSSELVATRPWVAAADRARLDAHAEAIRSVERRLDAAPVLSAICETPAEPTVANTDIPAVADVMMDLIVAAMACDITRTATFAFGRGTLAFTPTFLGLDEHYHAYSHYTLDEADKQEQYTRLLNWTSDKVASFIERFAAIPEADGESMLHHSLLAWNTDNGSGAAHTVEDVPFILAGQGGGSLTTGRTVTYPPGTKHNRLLLSVAQAFGHDIEAFGPAEYCAGGSLERLFG